MSIELTDFSQVVFWGALVTFIYMNMVHLLALYKKDASLVDIAWGPGFVVLVVALLVLSENSEPRTLLVAGLTAIWGIRLGLHILRRKIGKPEDWRYKKWRDEWSGYYVRAYFQVFILQGFLLLLISSTFMLTLYDADSGALGLINYIGVGIWLVGFIFEALGDWQLDKFLAKPRKKDQIMDAGLWRYTRHPNYFGEVTMWWGLWLAAYGIGYWIAAILSPIVISILILKVSGITLLEKKYDENQNYQDYKKVTSSFFPLPRKSKQ